MPERVRWPAGGRLRKICRGQAAHHRHHLPVPLLTDRVIQW